MMSDTILAVLISSGFNLIALIVMKLFDYKRARNERKFIFLKEFRAEKLKAYSILSEKIFNINFNNLNSIKSFNENFYYKYCYSFVETKTHLLFANFALKFNKYKDKLLNKTLNEKELVELGKALSDLTIQIHKDIQKDKEILING